MSLTSGVLGGSGIIYVMDVLDDRFRAPEELREQLGAPVLAIIRQLPELHGKGANSLHVHVTPDSVESEAFRTLRTTLAFLEPIWIAWQSAAPNRATEKQQFSQT